MDPHPTPFPGKRQGAVASGTSKEGNQKGGKTSKEPAPDLPPSRPKRTFGVPRNTNITMERPSHKPVASKFGARPSKPEKPNTRKEAQTISSEKANKAGEKKPLHVSFIEEVEAKPLRTPVSSSLRPDRPPGTPYLSAENCGKCRLDKLETATYWLSQIKLAEAARKHFVSAGFFRLAHECNAQPFHSLQEELKHYVKRHGVFCRDTVWIDLNDAYKITDDKVGANPRSCIKIDCVSVEPKDPESGTRNVELDLDEVNDESGETIKDNEVEENIGKESNSGKEKSGAMNTTPSQEM